MVVKTNELENYLEDIGVPERTYGVLVTDVGRGTQVSVEVKARCDVSAASIARYMYYQTHGRAMTAIHTRTVVVEDSILINGIHYYAPKFDHMRMGV